MGQQLVPRYSPPEPATSDDSAPIIGTIDDAEGIVEFASAGSDVGSAPVASEGRRPGFPTSIWQQVTMPAAASPLTEAAPPPRRRATTIAAAERTVARGTAPAERAVENDRLVGGMAALANSLFMQRDDLPPPQVDGRVSSPLPARTEVEQGTSAAPLRQAFVMPNRNPPEPPRAENAARSEAGTTSNVLSSGRKVAVPLGALMTQWTMSTGDDLRTESNTSGHFPAETKQPAREASWTIQIPSVINPFTQTDSQQPRRMSGGGIIQSLFEEEELPAPSDPPVGAADQALANQNGGDGPSVLAEAERLGEEPEDTSLQFLRTSTVLLKPGESQFDIGITYLLSESSFPILLVDEDVAVGADNVDFRIRELTVPMQYRFGLLKRVQAFIGMPIGWSNTQVAIDSFEAFQNDGGIGDLDFGATCQLIDGNATKPHMLATISITAPTGSDPFGATAALASSAPSLGQGFWSISGNVLCIQTYDPLVLFYGVGTEHYIGREFRGLEFDPGDSWSYRFGIGFAVSDRVTLSTRFQGAYVEEVRVDRERIFGSNVEPMSLRMAATISKPCKRIVEPFVEFGLTEGAVSSYFGVTWTF